MNLGENKKIGSSVGNKVDRYEKLCFITTGDVIDYTFVDDSNNIVEIKDGHIINSSLEVEIINLRDLKVK